ncbi:hypothetical protein AJ80_05258 [Polytolypa hystricis UAMH7299]|uniref:Uncharacterized protein n=1 Tax=Polytolypa hystricis (strain UAMH7299) TaxID=1447883 RepID=A0A2B7Y4V0_POLH7|nr:hypothetical protein AJ80_05258 [Polytolypa hystricis UAMH7299]
MRLQILVILAVTLAAVTALPNRLEKRKKVTWDKKGNLNIIFSDDVVNIGDIKIDDVMKKLDAACYTEGVCNTRPFELKGQIHSKGLGSTSNNIKLIVNPDGAYPTWIHNGLLQALHAAVKKVAKCKNITSRPKCSFTQGYCPHKPFTTNQCKVPKFWGINFQHPKEKDAAPPAITADMDVKVDHGGFCTELFTSLSAVAGAVNGVAGGIFLLAGLSCKD